MRIIYEPRGRALEYAPLAVSLYRGCSHGCRYCFVPAATRTTHEAFLSPAPRKNALNLLERDAADLARDGDEREILMSFTTDPYQPIETEFGLTRAAIEILIKYGLHFTILTKAGLRSVGDIDLLAEHPELCRYGTSLVFQSEMARERWEPFAAPTEDRIANLSMMHQLGVSTWVSCEPVFDTEQTLALIKQTLPFVDEYRIGKLNHFESDITQKDYQKFISDVVWILRPAGKKYVFKKDLLAAARGMAVVP